MMTLSHALHLAYVALSRATCLAGLQVLNFHPSVLVSIIFSHPPTHFRHAHRVMAHPKVLRYYEQLDASEASPVVPTVADPDD